MLNSCKIKRIIACPFVCFVLISTPLISEAQPGDTLSVERVISLSVEEMLNVKVISASKRKEDPILAPASIYVVTEKEIIQNGYYNLTELLEDIPGADIINPEFFAFGGQRGLLGNFSNTLLLINGREMQNLIAAETFISHQFATHNIKQVEVMNGPGSVLYGANALTGVINIILKDQDAEYEGLEYQFDFGTENTMAHSFVFRKKHEEFSLGGSFRYFESDMWDFTDFINDTNNYKQGFSQNAYVPDLDYHNKTMAIPISLNLAFKGFYIGTDMYFLKSGKGQEIIGLNYTSQYDLRDLKQFYAGYDFTLSEYLSGNAEFRYYNEIFHGREYKYNDSIYNELLRNGIITSAPLTDDEIFKYFMSVYSQESSSGSDRYYASITLNYLKNNRSLIGGYVFDQYDLLGLSISSTFLNPPFDETVDENNVMRRPFYKQTMNSLFLQYQEPFINDRLHLTLGARLDHHSIHDFIFTTRSGIVFLPGKRKSAIKFLFGQAFRQPTIFEQGAMQTKVNLEVKPTRINSYEISASHQPNQAVYGSITMFTNEVFNFIIPDNRSENLVIDQYRLMYGLEGIVKLKSDNFSANIAYTYIHPTKEEFDGTEYTGLGVYQNRASIGLNYFIKQLIHVNTQINYYDGVSAMHGNLSVPEVIDFDPYIKANLTVSTRELPLYTSSLKVMFTIKNITGGKHYQPNIRFTGAKQFLQPGRQFITRLIVKI
jgi:outer membrane cobalamin receptor